MLTSSNSTEGFTGTVLMIEDEEMLRRAVSKLLRENGLRVLEAGDGRAAVELFRTHASEVDVVLLDVTLPGLSGREVLRALRESVNDLVGMIRRTCLSEQRAKAFERGSAC
jgi:DNA-binding response OmpR family regulator